MTGRKVLEFYTEYQSAQESVLLALDVKMHLRDTNNVFAATATGCFSSKTGSIDF